jgi:hypothetical protein
MKRYRFSRNRMFAALCASCFALAVPLTAEAKFDERDLKGSYAFGFEGVITFIGGQPVLLPTWGVGHLRADGNGRLFGADVTINFGGCVILRQSGSGEYSVERNGTGSGELTLTNDAVEPVGVIGDPCPALDAGLIEEPMAISFDFAISRAGFDFVGLGLRIPKAIQSQPLVLRASLGHRSEVEGAA